MKNETYTIDANGAIKNPGRFQGQMLYVPYFWDMGLEGFADRDDGQTFGFDLTENDKKKFPELRGRRTIKIYQRNDGFISEIQGRRKR